MATTCQRLCLTTLFPLATGEALVISNKHCLGNCELLRFE